MFCTLFWVFQVPFSCHSEHAPVIPSASEESSADVSLDKTEDVIPSASEESSAM